MKQPMKTLMLFDSVADQSVTVTIVDIGVEDSYHSADFMSRDYKIDLSELLRVIQLYTHTDYHCGTAGEEDGYGLGKGDRSCIPHSADYSPGDWKITLSELLRVIQFYNMGYHPDADGEDGFATGPGHTI